MANFPLGEAILGTGVDLSGLTSGLSRAEGAAAGAVGKIGGVFSNLLGGVLQGVGQSLFGLIQQGVSGITDSMIGGNAEFERYTVQFGVLLGSAEAAQARLADLAEFGAKTPFELPEVVQADKILQGFGLHAADVAERFGFSGEQIRTIAGDVAAGTGASFQDMATLIGKFASGATGEAISRFQEMGIVTREQLAQMGLEFSKSGQLLTPVDEAMDVVLAAMKDKFGGMMDAQSSTFEGMLSNLQDWLGQTGRMLGEPVFDALKDQLGNLLTLLNSPEFQAGLQAVAQGLGVVIGTLVDFVTSGGDLGLMIDNIREGFSGILPPEVIAGLVGVIGAIRDGMPAAQAVIDSVLASILSIDFGPLLAALGALFGTIMGGMPPAGDVFGAVASGIVGYAQAVADFMNGVLIPGLTAVVAWVTANWPTIQATVQQVMTGVQTVITTVTTTVQALWSEWGDEIMAVVDGVTKYLSLIFSGFSKAFAGDWRGFGEDLRKAWDLLWKGIQQIASDAFLWFTRQDWGAIGTSILQGIAAGISAASSFVIDAAKRAVQAAIDAVTGFIDAHSPAQLPAEEIGLPFSQGIARGILAGMPEIRNAAAAAGATMMTDGRVFNVDARGATVTRSEIEDLFRRLLNEVASNSSDRLSLGTT